MSSLSNEPPFRKSLRFCTLERVQQHARTPGEVAWGFEYIDRLGRFVNFYCGAIGTPGFPARDSARPSWSEKCTSLPELVKLMASDAGDRPGYDEVKVFEVENADPDLAMQVVQRNLDDPGRTKDALEETRDILTRYGARGLALPRGFSAPFLWYNILPGRSVAIRKLPIHLFQLRAASEAQGQATGEEVEDQARRVAQSVSEVLGLGECFVARVRTGFIVGINVAVDPGLRTEDGWKVSRRVEEAIRGANPRIRHIFVQVMPHETG